MDIILIRHGQSKGNAKNIVQGHSCEGLSDLGWAQAKAIGKYFNVGDLDVIYASDIRRACETATPTAEKLNLEIKKDSGLREASFGIWEGMVFDEVREKYSDEYHAWHNDYYQRPEWFEAFDTHQTRVKAVLEKILNTENKDSKVAVFTHGGSIKTQVGFFKKLNGVELKEYRFANCSLSLVRFEEELKYEKGKLIYYNKKVIPQEAAELM